MATEYQLGDNGELSPVQCNGIHVNTAAPIISELSADIVDAGHSLTPPTHHNRPHDEIVNQVHQVLTRETAPDSVVTTANFHTNNTDSSHQLIWGTSNGMVCLIWLSFESEIDLNSSINDFTESALSKSVSGEINACMYIAVHAHSIPKVGVFKMDTISGIPCIYLADSQDSRVTLNIVSQCMQQMWRWQCSTLGTTHNTFSTVDDQTSRDRRIVNAFVADTVDCCRSVTNGFVNRKRWIHHLEQQLEQDEAELIAFTRRLHTLRTSSQWIDSDRMATHAESTSYRSTTNTTSSNRFVNKIVEYYTQNKKWPKRTDVDINPSEARTAGGYKQLVSLAREKTLAV